MSLPRTSPPAGRTPRIHSLHDASTTGHRTRLREKVLADGLDAMAPHELLELLLCYAIPRSDVKPLAKSLLQGASLGGVLTRDPSRLVQEPGIGPHAASLMALCARIHRELVCEAESTRVSCQDPEDLVPWFRSQIGLAEDERFAVVYLDQQGRILARKVFDPGSRTRTVLYARELFEAALQVRATGMVLAHNHPAGSLQPSTQDRELTRRVRELGASLEVSLVDHLIVTRRDHASFCRNGWL